MEDFLRIGNIRFSSRLLTGTGKFSSLDHIPQVLEKSGSEMITVALRRVDRHGKNRNILEYIPETVTLLPNTSGARSAQEAVRIAELARAGGCGDFIKIEVIRDMKYLMPDNAETVKATRMLAERGFIVLPYMTPDPSAAQQLEQAGAAAVMPLGSPIGSNRGLETKEMIRIIIEMSHVPVIVDAGIGRPSHAAMAMEMGADAVLVNTAIATSGDPAAMAEAFSLAVRAGRNAFLQSMPAKLANASASSPLTGFLD
ncbi:MAG: thiazole synthase [Thermodesulfobacteriota bacterium]